MTDLSRWFLRAKHWQIFVVMVATYLLSVVVPTGVEVTHPELEHVTHFSPLYLLAGAAYLPLVLSWFGWLWTVGLFLNSTVKPELRLPTGLFGFALACPLALFFAAPPLFIALLPSDSSAVGGALIAGILLVWAGIFYATNFVAKTLKLSELRRPLMRLEHGMEFGLVLFAPIGIWLIQPRVNRCLRRAGKAR